ncbi:hypothetical protein [Enterovirga aerilata]|uniref:Uncharacterized protein n=1 Tax=Enterovirga aerilata TaxID=2730920 RepID=A0A849IBU8_9HYPH|nr:hypothetical protein [Enterovirga sp. DB1703]NNM74751.1 hypothetical protein [Enterovirga sp. DB1703]
MADTYTANYNLTKPEVGASRDTWGTKINANFDTLDGQLKAVSNIANAALPRTGSTGNVSFTGNLGVTGDITTSRSATEGVIYLGADGQRYLHRDQSGNYHMPGGTLTVGGYQVARQGVFANFSDMGIGWGEAYIFADGHAPVIRSGANPNYRYFRFDADGVFYTAGVWASANVSAGGRLTANTNRTDGGYVEVYDNDGSRAYLHYNNPNFGILRADGGWGFYGTNDGFFWAGSNYGWLHDYVNARAAAHAATRPGYGFNTFNDSQRVEKAWPAFELNWSGVRHWIMQIWDNGGWHLYDQSGGNWAIAVTTDHRFHIREVGDVINWVNSGLGARADWGYVNGCITDIYLTSSNDWAFGNPGIVDLGGPWVMVGAGYINGHPHGRSCILQRRYRDGGVYNIART